MKTKIISIVVMLMMAVNVMGEDLAYFYLNNGRCIPLPVSVLSKMEVSKLDINNIQHSDYQTQKIVTNDTTVFISLSEIDSIVFDRKEITDYPKTESEIKESIDLSNSIASKSKQIVDSLADLGEMDINVIVEEIRKLDGVIVANADSSQSVINIIQKDGICINKLMKIDESTYIDENEEEYDKSFSPILSPSPRRIEMRQGNDEPYLAPHGQALILAPFQSSFGKYMNYFREQFEYAYDKYPVVFENNSADILKFKGDNLSKYDFLFIDTHGCYECFNAIRNSSQNFYFSLFKDHFIKKTTTVLCSGTKYDYFFIDHYVNKEKSLTWDQIIIVDEDGELYVAMDHSFIDGYSFDGCIVFASACLAGRDKTSDTSLMKAFLDNGAALYAGFELVINSAVCESIDTGIIGLFAHGVSFQDAKQYWINSSYLKKTVDTARKTGLYKTEELDPQRFVYRVNPKLSNSKIFLKNPYPSLYPAVVDKETIGFAWETELEGFTTYSQTIELVNFQERKARKNRFNVQFNLVNDLYVDGKLYKCANEEKSLTIPANEFSVGDHSWYVTSSLYDDENNIVCTYSSNEEKFIIPEPIQNLVISQNNVVVNPGSTTTVEITSGNGGYTVYVDKPNIATATLSGTTISIKGEAKGTAKVTVKDKSGQTAEIIVSVVSSSESYAVYNAGTLTFYHDQLKGSREGTKYALNTGDNFPGWRNNFYDITKVVFDKSFADARPTTTYAWFELGNLTTIENIEYLNTSEVTNMARMFDGCNITSLDLRSFNTGKVTNMHSMFGWCGELISLNITSFDTSNVTDMSFMFYGCSLTSLNLSNFNTSKVTNMEWMFAHCSKLTSLDVSHFDTRNVTDMNHMFLECNSLTSLDVSNFDTENVTNMHSMFGACRKLSSLDVSNFNTRNVTSMGFMFYICEKLTSLDISNFKTENVTGMDYMFTGCSNLTVLDVSKYNTKNVTNLSWMFAHCSKLTSLDVSNFDTRNVIDMSYMFYFCSNLKTLDVSNFNMASCEKSKSMFGYCYGLNTLAVSSTMENLDENACELVGYYAPCTIIVPDGFDFGVDTSGNSFKWKSGYFKLGNSVGICPDQHHPHMIDLGLPSGKKWACCNVGASSPEQSGGYYAWGETSEKDVYDWNSYICCSGSLETCYDIGDDISGTNYDVAHVHRKWGGNWRMPNLSEAKELFSYCSHKETYYNGVYGYMFTGSNGKSIFVPAAGYKNESTLYRNGDNAALWLSTIGDDYYEATVFRLLVTNPFTGNYSWSRNRGLSVRPIHP